MPPLNTSDGQKWMNQFILKHGAFDLMIFDNIQSLTLGDQTKEESWTPVLEWIASLTRRRIAQIWFHHTGHVEDRSYGTKTREWRMDLVGLMERAGQDEIDLAFRLKFDKCRERTPENRAEFAPVTIRLVNDQWSFSEGKAAAKKKEPTGNTRLALDALTKALLKDGKIPPSCNDIPDNTPTVSEDLWRACAFSMGLGSDTTETKVKNQAFKRAVQALEERDLVRRWNGEAWSLKEKS